MAIHWMHRFASLFITRAHEFHFAGRGTSIIRELKVTTATKFPGGNNDVHGVSGRFVKCGQYHPIDQRWSNGKK